MAQLISLGTVTIVAEKTSAGVKTEHIENAVLFQCESAEELKELIRSRGTLTVQFSSPTPTPTGTKPS